MGAPIISPGTQGRFLFLQGPHGPFFGQLAEMLRAAGARVWRVGFNAGDAAFWRDRESFIPFRAHADRWSETLVDILDNKAITDLVLYGDTRPIHAQAVKAAQARGLRVHVFEEGYLRPYWITYERGGSNGNSRLMDLGLDAMRAALAHSDTDLPDTPGHWGETRQHIWYGALYHWHILFRNRRFRQYRPHRALPVRTEFRLHLRRLLLMPAHALERVAATRAIARAGFPFHLVLLQLEHDSSFLAHSPFGSMTEFLAVCIAGFADGAPRHHHLVFKAHPLEDGRTPLRRDIQRIAAAAGVADRVHFVRGGKLAALLDFARSAITVNSTAGQQVLWRGLPLRCFGAAVYAKPEFVSRQPLPEFFGAPTRPDSRAYRDFRAYLLETSQIAGGYYSAAGRRRVMRQVVDMMLSPHDPYEALASGNAPPRQQIRLVQV
ncbi:capsule biosynthesis protein [Tropicimonas marinistellae]|uniref:capsule biosynthesis protein n=1 Tax=Tropicimonas marinistellae TaxID=1739787 RepID=UPI00082E794A|nr:capsule biosynthesis protein CapA [Tropicimonas marinistellae]